MKLLFTCTLMFILLMSTVNALAQTEDYIITLKGDTVKCSISTPFTGANKYTIPGEEAKKMERDVIKEYYITRKNLRKRAVFKEDKSKAEFMTVIENGRISLYEVVYNRYSQYGSTSTTEWYVGKASDRVSGLKTSSLFLGKSRQDRKDAFADMLKDKPEVHERYMTEKKFSFDAIQNLVYWYNTGKALADEKMAESKKYEVKKDDAY